MKLFLMYNGCTQTFCCFEFLIRSQLDNDKKIRPTLYNKRNRRSKR